MKTREEGETTVDEPEKPKKKGKKRRSKKFYILLSLFIVLALFGSGASFVGYRIISADYQKYTALAQNGVQHLKTAVTLLQSIQKNPFNAQVVNKAQQEFSIASSDFVQLNGALKSLPGSAFSVPSFGSRARAALHVVPIAIEVAQSGIVACNILNVLIASFHDPLNTKAQGLTLKDFTTIEKDFNQITSTLALATTQIDHLQPSDLQLDPRLSKIVATFHMQLPTIQTWLKAVEDLFPAIPALLGIGTPTNYLIELLDSTELRPGGGFIGNIGILTMAGGRLTAAHITDVYLLDRPFENAHKVIPYPSAYAWFDLAPNTWTLRDSNLDADFPTAAHYSELDYKLEGGNVPVQGVIAITPTLIQNALGITGPISVPEYHEVVSAKNLIDRIHYYQLGAGRQGDDVPSADGHSSVRKHFTELLAEHFLARMRTFASSALPKMLQLMVSSLRSKDLQVYLNSSSAEKFLQRLNLASTIQAPTGDSLFVVDANIAPSKANSYITNTLNDRVSLDAYGNAVHHTTIAYAWLTNGPVYGFNPYRDYVRVYVPPGSILQQQSGWEPRGTSKAFGRQVWAGFFTLSYRQTLTITLVWTTPGAAWSDASGWHYQYMIQRQAGAQWKLNLWITPPFCGYEPGATIARVSTNRPALVLSQLLTQDLATGINYNRKAECG